MDLKDFVKEAIKELSEAIHEANKELNEVGTIVNPQRVTVNNPEHQQYIYGYMLDTDEKQKYRRPVHLMNFDVAVVANEKKGKNGKIGVEIAGIGFGVNGSGENTNIASNRLTFKIPISLPTGNN